MKVEFDESRPEKILVDGVQFDITDFDVDYTKSGRMTLRLEWRVPYDHQITTTTRPLESRPGEG